MALAGLLPEHIRRLACLSAAAGYPASAQQRPRLWSPARYCQSQKKEGGKVTGRQNREHSNPSELFTVVKDLRAGSSEFKYKMTPEAFNVKRSFKPDLGAENSL